MPNGVEFQQFPINNHPALHNEKKIITFAGNLAPYQGIDLLLHSFKLLCQSRDDVLLRIISQDSFEPYEPLAQQLGVQKNVEVIYSGFTQLPHHLATANVAVNPRPKCDGLPQKLLNYMAARKPIVSFEGAGKYVIDGRTGIMVKDGDIQAFVKAINWLLDHPEEADTMGKNGHDLIRSSLSWENTAYQTELVYDRVLKRSSDSTILQIEGSSTGMEE